MTENQELCGAVCLDCIWHECWLWGVVWHCLTTHAFVLKYQKHNNQNYPEWNTDERFLVQYAPSLFKTENPLLSLQNLDRSVDSGYTFLVTSFFFFPVQIIFLGIRCRSALADMSKETTVGASSWSWCGKEGQRVVKDKSWCWTEMRQMQKGQGGSNLI